MGQTHEEQVKKLLLIGGVLALGIFLLTLRVVAWKKEIKGFMTKNVSLPSPIERAKEQFNQIWQNGSSIWKSQPALAPDSVTDADNANNANNAQEDIDQKSFEELKKKIEEKISQPVK